MNIFKSRKPFFSTVTFASFQLFFVSLSQAAKAPSSKQKLETIATHIVVGKVQAVYSHKEREGIPLVSGYEYDHKVAEVKIEKVEKGKVSEKLIYVRYWSRKWKGLGFPLTGGQSYENQPKKDQTYRFYLAKNSYDGLSEKGNQDGGYNVVYVNGVQPIKE
tara:strand:+ start:107 stop:589 length:483 start_codon:yes stop_codon:yes gene_type:complete